MDSVPSISKDRSVSKSKTLEPAVSAARATDNGSIGVPRDGEFNPFPPEGNRLSSRRVEAEMRTKALAVGVIVAASSVMFAPSALAFEPSADPKGKFSCPDEQQPVPGHPGFPGIATGVEKSFVESGGIAAAAWSATVEFGGPLAVC